MADKTKSPKKESPELMEISTQESLLYLGINGNRLGFPVYHNPDELVQKKGLTIYRQMRDDDQIKAVLTLKKYAIMANPWTVVPASDEPKDIEVAEFVEDQFYWCPGVMEDYLMEIMTAIEYGFSITEIVYKVVESGKWKGKIGLKKLATREPFNYEFKMDEHGNLDPAGILFLGTKMEQYPTDKFIIYSYRKEGSNWYGQSDLKSAYRSWWSKEILIRFFNMYMERFGMPTTIGTYKKGLATTEVDKLKTVLNNIQAKYSITIPEDITISLLKDMPSGANFKDAIEMHNRFMARSMLMPDTIGYTEAQSGGFTMGKKQFDVFLWSLKKQARDLEENVIGEQLIKRLVDYNYDVDKYPSFQFQSLTDEDTEAKARIIRLGVDGGFINPEEPWVREYLNLPTASDEYPLGKQNIFMQNMLQGAPAGKPQPEGKAPAMGKKGTPKAEIPEEETWVSAMAPKKTEEKVEVRHAEVPVTVIERIIDVESSKELKELKHQIKKREEEVEKILKKQEKTKGFDEVLKKQEKEIKKLKNKLELERMKKNKIKLTVKQEKATGKKLDESVELVEIPTEPVQQLLAGLNWVVRCPYHSCGSQEIKVTEALRNGAIYECDTCNHMFKVLKDGDLYFFDDGKEEWVRQGDGTRPSYFTVRLKGREFKFASISEMKESLTEAREKGLEGSTKLEVEVTHG